MYRRSCCLWFPGYHVSSQSRVALFPVHLDPPTLQHREMLRLLLGIPCSNHSIAPSLSSEASSLTSSPSLSRSAAYDCAVPRGSGVEQRHQRILTSPSGSGAPSTPLVHPQFWYMEPFAQSLRRDSQLGPFDDIVLIPNTRTPVGLRQSTHFAALAVLATRGLPNVHVDFTALEHPNESMPIIHELTQRYRNCAIIHWLHDADEMQNWLHFSEIKLKVPFLFLLSAGLPTSALGKPPPLEAERPKSSQQSVGPIVNAAPGPHASPSSSTLDAPAATNSYSLAMETTSNGSGSNGGNSSFVKRMWWKVKGGRGDEQVEISRSYSGTASSSWLGGCSEDEVATPDDSPASASPSMLDTSGGGGLNRRLFMADRPTHRGGQKGFSESGADGYRDGISTPIRSGMGHVSDDAWAAKRCRGTPNDSQEETVEGRVRAGEALSDANETAGSETEHLAGQYYDLNDIKVSSPARRNVRQLIDELYASHARLWFDGDSQWRYDGRQGYYDQECRMDSDELDTSAENGRSLDGDSSPLEAGDAVMSPSEIPMVEVHSIVRCTGADVRQALWEKDVDATVLLTDCVQRYIESHGLYRDYRKNASVNASFNRCGSSLTSGSFGTDGAFLCDGGLPGMSVGGLSGRRPPQKDAATMFIPGLVPRLELHYDKNNLLAREQYERLKVFQQLDGEEPDLIVPIGGDGYMMHCIRKNWRRFIPFFGINAGHVGYLLNDCATLEELFSYPLKLHTTTMLYCQAEKETSTGEKVLLSELAFNDAWVERSSGQTALICILVNGEERIRRLRGDGVLVSTAAGSTAYSRALGASPVPVGAPLIQVVGSNVVSPAQWRPAHLDQEDHVELEVIDSFKRPCRCFVDSVDMGTVTRMLVRSSRVAGVTLAFSSSCDLQQKLYQLQFPKSL